MFKTGVVGLMSVNHSPRSGGLIGVFFFFDFLLREGMLCVLIRMAFLLHECMLCVLIRMASLR